MFTRLSIRVEENERVQDDGRADWISKHGARENTASCVSAPRQSFERGWVTTVVSGGEGRSPRHSLGDILMGSSFGFAAV